MSDKQTADAVNTYVPNGDMLDELQYFRHKQFINIRANCTFNACDKGIHSRGLEMDKYKLKYSYVVSYNVTHLQHLRSVYAQSGLKLNILHLCP
jgi:hypothetical protein